MREKEEQFRKEMQESDRQAILSAQAKIVQANAWATRLGLSRRYAPRMVTPAPLAADPSLAESALPAGLPAQELRVVYVDDGVESRDVPVPMFCE